MEYITLGKSGLRISRVGLGGIPIQRTDEDGAKAVMDACEENGINFIDTARGYTVSEQYIGKALEGRRDKFIIATKSMARTYDAMKNDISISLGNLKTDHIDLYQVHNPSSVDEVKKVCQPGGALEALLEAKENGSVHHIGLTCHTTEIFEYALTLDWVETLMFPYNIVESQGEQLMQKCAEKNIGFIAMKPLAGGAIEDASLAIRYICANPCVSVVIPGMYSTDEVGQNVAAASDASPLSGDELEKIENIKKELGENFCRRCGYCAPCTVGINIPASFLFAGYLERYGLEGWARERYATMSVKAGACIECGVCETRCPYNLPIRQMLKKCAEDFGE